MATAQPAAQADAAAPAIVAKPGCPWCAKVHTGMADSTCYGCRAREIARSPAAWAAVRGDRNPHALQDSIVKTFGPAGYAAARRAVWDWMQRLGVLPY